MNALILAAGAGTRLNSNLPKSLLRVGGMTILERTVLSLEQIGVKRENITAVAGFRHELLHRACLKADVSAVNNPLWRFPGTYSSFYAPGKWSGEVLIVHGDLLWERGLLSGIRDVPGDIVVPVDPGSRFDPEAMKTETRGGKVLHLSKHLPVSRSAGESMGIFLIREPALLRNMSTHLLYKLQASLDDAVNIAAGRMRVEAFFTGKSAWEEVDTPVDLNRARELFS